VLTETVTGAPSSAVNPVYICLIIRDVRGAPSGAVNPVYIFLIRRTVSDAPPVLLIL